MQVEPEDHVAAFDHTHTARILDIDHVGRSIRLAGHGRLPFPRRLAYTASAMVPGRLLDFRKGLIDDPNGNRRCEGVAGFRHLVPLCDLITHRLLPHVMPDGADVFDQYARNASTDLTEIREWIQDSRTGRQMNDVHRIVGARFSTDLDLSPDVQVVDRGVRIAEELPETILASLRGTPLHHVVGHPAFDHPDLVIVDVVALREFGRDWTVLRVNNPDVVLARHGEAPDLPKAA